MVTLNNIPCKGYLTKLMFYTLFRATPLRERCGIENNGSASMQLRAGKEEWKGCMEHFKMSFVSFTVLLKVVSFTKILTKVTVFMMTDFSK